MARNQKRLAPLLIVLIAELALQTRAVAAPSRQSQPSAAQAGAARAVGTVKAISGNSITLSTDAGSEVIVTLQDEARILRVEPGEKDLKNAVALDLQDVQAGDRVLVRGKMADDGKSLLASSLIAMKKMAIAQKQARERAEWGKNGVGGLVSGVDPATGIITISTTNLGASKTVLIHVSQETQLRRYAANSIKFDDAKAAPVTEIKAGDQLRARGTRSTDGGDLTADEVVSGSFRNIAGTISSIDASAGTITVADLASKKQVVIKVTAEAQLRKLSVPMAQRIAARLKGASAESAVTGTQSSGESRTTEARGATRVDGTDAARPAQGASDLQQAIGRMPATTLGELKDGDAVMIVATPGTQDSVVMAITLLAGVEPILQASPKAGQSILSPWNLSSPGGEAAAP
jgi:hypothetical protein